MCHIKYFDIPLGGKCETIIVWNPESGICGRGIMVRIIWDDDDIFNWIFSSVKILYLIGDWKCYFMLLLNRFYIISSYLMIVFYQIKLNFNL